MYIVMVHFIVGICDLSWPLMASKTEKYHILVFFLHIFFIFFANSTSPMDYTLIQDLKKVYYIGGSLVANAMEAIIFHQINPYLMYHFKPPRWCTYQEHAWVMKLVTSIVPWQCTLNERLKKVHHVGVYLMKVHGLHWRAICPLKNPPYNKPFLGPGAMYNPLVRLNLQKVESCQKIIFLRIWGC